LRYPFYRLLAYIDYGTLNAESALKALGITPDVDASQSPIRFVHRKLDGGDVYFLDNRSDQPALLDASFRVTDKAPEFWYAETGKAEPVSYNIAAGRTTVPLRLELGAPSLSCSASPRGGCRHTGAAGLGPRPAPIVRRARHTRRLRRDGGGNLQLA
jgi:hypothetical protein